MPDNRLPLFQDLLWPTLRAIRGLGGSARIDEIVEQVIANEGFSEEQVAISRPGHHLSLLQYRLAWARNYLKNIGAIENSTRGVWALTDRGHDLNPEELWPLVKAWKTQYNREYAERKRSRQSEASVSSSEAPEAEEDDEGVGLEADDEAVSENWKDRLLATLSAMHPSAFERLCQRLLREANFRSVEVLGKSGDGGIDGTGVYQVSLISFRVFFQCKRYSGSVGPAAVRDFRGAMSGRGDKGLLITTGVFTKDARSEANRDGASPIDLVDGSELCDLLLSYSLGVRSVERVITEVVVNPAFFDGL